MANRSNEPSGYSKEKMLFLRDMFAEHSDTENGLRMVDIQDKVEREYGIRPDRKTIQQSSNRHTTELLISSVKHHTSAPFSAPRHP